MKRFVSLLLVFLFCPPGGFAQRDTRPSNQLLIVGADVDYSLVPLRMIIRGENFSDTLPTVRLNGNTLPLHAYSPVRIEALLPVASGGGLALTPGSYLLTVAVGAAAAQFDAFSVTLGAAGPKGDTGSQGPQGAIGPVGATGVQGTTGATGVQGPGGFVTLPFSGQNNSTQAVLELINATGPGMLVTSGGYASAVNAASNGTGAGIVGTSTGGIGLYGKGGLAPLRLELAQSVGAPLSGSHAAGEMYVDASATLYYCKVAGTPGMWVVLDEAGPVGPQGFAGPKGETGAQGIQGSVGPQGATGAQGIKGDTGTSGGQGPAGPQGVTGAAGAQGVKGDVGPSGPSGDVPSPAGYVTRYAYDGSPSDSEGLNNPITANAVSYTSSPRGTGLKFGPGGFIEVASSASLTSPKFSVDAWVRPDGFGPTNDWAGNSIVTKVTNGCDHQIFLAWVPSTERFLFTSGPSGCGSDQIISRRTFPPGAYYHVTATFDGARFRLYVNGELEGERASSQQVQFTSSLLTIGNNPREYQAGYPRTWNGVIDEIRFYDYAIVPGQGLAGPAGPQGLAGSTGLAGATGPKGDKGDPGVVTLPYGGTTASQSWAFNVENSGGGGAIRGFSSQGTGAVGASSNGVGAAGVGGTYGLTGTLFTLPPTGAAITALTQIAAPIGTGVYGYSYGPHHGVYGASVDGTGVQGTSSAGIGVLARGGGSSPGLKAVGGASSGYGIDVTGGGPDGHGIVTRATGRGYGIAASAAPTGVAVYGENSGTGDAIVGNSLGTGYAVRGTSAASGRGGFFFSQSNYALVASSGTYDGLLAETSSTTNAAIVGSTPASAGRAGVFYGRVEVTGALSAATKNFRIDHPLDPENKYLVHTSVESADMMNIYNGNIVLDAKGEANVSMPDWFEALNREFRYQLTSIGGFNPIYIADELVNNRFKIAGGRPGAKISWQVTGIRKDPWAEANRTAVEEAKSENDRGSYLHAEAYGQPEERSVLAKRKVRDSETPK